jgi:hypothetical protein
MSAPIRHAYPLQWPDGWPRTPASRRQRGTFSVTFARARDELLDELRRLGARGVVLSTMIPTRRDGLPYAGRSFRSGDDPGVCVYFTLGGREKAIPCDRYSSPEANVRALGLAVAAMRALERHGVSGLLDRAFVGLDALPPPRAPWRQVFGFWPGERPSADAIRERYRALAKLAHPDVGGEPGAMERLNHARDEALKDSCPGG